MFEVTGTAQLASWKLGSLPPTEQVRSDLWSIPLPIPDSPLRYTSAYALASVDGVTLIDTGWDSDVAWQALCDGLASFGASVMDVRGALITHLHFDHIGLARRLREVTGAWIGLHSADRDELVCPEFRDPPLARSTDVEWLVSAGSSREEALHLCSDVSRFVRRQSIAVPDRIIEDGQDLGVPGWSLRAIHTPGHTPGHLCFYDERTCTLFAGDHILPRITPNVGGVRPSSGDSLGAFLESLEVLIGLNVQEVLPAHEWRFRGLKERVSQLRDHHSKRLSEIFSSISRAPGSTLWEIASNTSWSRPWDQCIGRMRIAAVTETMAHVSRLVNGGSIVPKDGAVPRYDAV
jgi:glyoxylase-like metal-dependent hydrolase (beta-lactamase superfamily II)